MTDVTEINGIGPSTAKRLEEEGYPDLESLANASDVELESLDLTEALIAKVRAWGKANNELVEGNVLDKSSTVGVGEQDSSTENTGEDDGLGEGGENEELEGVSSGGDSDDGSEQTSLQDGQAAGSTETGDGADADGRSSGEQPDADSTDTSGKGGDADDNGLAGNESGATNSQTTSSTSLEQESATDNEAATSDDALKVVSKEQSAEEPEFEFITFKFISGSHKAQTFSWRAFDPSGKLNGGLFISLGDVTVHARGDADEDGDITFNFTFGRSVSAAKLPADEFKFFAGEVAKKFNRRPQRQAGRLA